VKLCGFANQIIVKFSVSFADLSVRLLTSGVSVGRCDGRRSPGRAFATGGCGGGGGEAEDCFARANKPTGATHIA